MVFQRHKTAIGRGEMSRPMRLATEAGLITPTSSVFDYGCGRGGDIALLQAMGVSVNGWDPTHRPRERKRPASVVNLGYVVNVIEDVEERARALLDAWSLSESVLVVAARLVHETDATRFEAYGDGFATRTGTFQKLFTQLELRDWIEQTVGEKCWPAAPGVFFVFRNQELRQSYIATRYRRRLAAPKPRLSDVLYEKHQQLLEPLMEFVTERGRLPERDELLDAEAVTTIFGSIPRAFAVIRRVTGPERWAEIREVRSQELLLRLALERLGGRSRYSELDRGLQRDVKEFLSSYSNACTESDRLLFQTGNQDELDRAMRKCGLGKLTGNALYIHSDAVHLLPILVRVYEGCARSYLGHVEGANIIKLHRLEPKVSYLSYPDFDRVAHPALHSSLRLKLSNVDVKYLDFSQSGNPPILHRKEEFLSADDPRRQKFAKLTMQEERYGLYADAVYVGTLQKWREVLRKNGVSVRGHRLCRVTSASNLSEPPPQSGAGV